MSIFCLSSCFTFVKTTTKRPKGSIDKGYHCPQCFGCFSSLRKHPNCKGQASDGGIVSKRKLRFCPICPGFMRIVAELVPHLTRASFKLKCHCWNKAMHTRVLFYTFCTVFKMLVHETIGGCFDY